MKAAGFVSTLQSADIVLPTTDGREIVCAGSLNYNGNRNPCFTNSVSACRNAESFSKCSADSAIA